MTSQRFDDTNATSGGLMREAIGDERIDFRPRLIHAHGVDREYGVEQSRRCRMPRRLRRALRGEPLERIAVRKPRALRAASAARASENASSRK